MQLQQLDPTLFDLFTWINGSPYATFGIPCIYSELTKNCNKSIFKQYAVGYCNGENLICRPKINHKAVMFCKDGDYLWFHFTNKEFEEIFS